MNAFHYILMSVEPSEQIDLHEQDDWELSCVLTGSGTRIIGNSSEPFSRGDLALIPPGMPHCWYFDDAHTDSQGRISNITIRFQQSLLVGLTQLFPELTDSVGRLYKQPQAHIFTGKAAKEIIGKMLAMDGQTDGERTATFLQIIVMLADYRKGQRTLSFRKNSPLETRRLQAETYVRCGLNKDITLDSLARHLGMNRSSLCVFFRREYGLTFTEYLNRQRIKEAQRLLSSNLSMSIQNVCFRVGFSNASYFNRVFKSISNCTPKEFKNLLEIRNN